MHLEDSRKIASDGVKHAVHVLDKLTVWAGQNIQATTEATDALLHNEKMASLRQDLEFCNQKLGRLRSYTQADQETLRQHFQMSQDLTLFRLTMLAAIFLPLSFTTSLFGMNMGNTEEGPGTFSSVTNSTLDNITDSNLRSSTEALVSIIASSGNVNYDWTVFAGTAIGLLFILPFTLAVGAVMRITVVSVVRYVKYWRALTLLIGGFLLLAVMSASILGFFIRRVVFLKSMEPFLQGLTESYDYAWWEGFSRSTRWLLYSYWAVNGWLLLGLIFLVYLSWSEGKERLFWTTQLLVTAGSFTADMKYVGWAIPFMIIPWVWLGLFNSWVRRRWWKALFERWR